MESSSANLTRNRSYFWCFISYNHQDNKTEGRQWANWLHHAIETYEVPPDLVGSMNERGEQIPSQIFPCFRDEEELAASADLNRSIYDALDRSRTLLVLCSRHAVESPYVKAEIRYFREHSLAGNKRVFAALLEGTPASSFPPELTEEMVATRSGESASTQGPPLAADFRLTDGSQGWTSKEAYRQDLKAGNDLRNHISTWHVERYGQKLEQAKLQLVAGIIGVPLGVLKARDKAYQLELSKRKARTRKRWLLAVGSLATIAVLISVIALMQLQTALRTRMAQYEAQSRAYQRNLQVPEALIYGLASISLGRSPFVRFPHFFSSNLSSEELLAGPTQAIPLHRVMEIGIPCIGFSDVSGIAAFPKRGTLIIADAFRPYICAIHQGITHSLTTGSGQVAVALTPHAETLLSIGKDGKIRSWNLDSGIEGYTGVDASRLLVDSGERYSTAALTPNGEALIVGNEDGTVLVIDLNGQVLTSAFQAHIGKVSAVAVFPDGDSFLCPFGKHA